MSAKLPQYTPTKKEWDQKAFSHKAQEMMLSDFWEWGCLQVFDVFRTTLITALHRECMQRYARFLSMDMTQIALRQDALGVGDKRWMLPVKLNGPFATRELFAPELIGPLLARVLGDELILNSCGIVLACPGAKAQHDHRDLPPLFGDTPIDTTIPTYAITMMIPLSQCDKTHGTTQLRPGSHRALSEQAKVMEGLAPNMPIGSCMLMDYRLQHGGTANPSTQVRPLLYMVFSKPWFRDYRNFKKRKLPPLWTTRKAWKHMSDEEQRLFVNAKRTWW